MDEVCVAPGPPPDSRELYLPAPHGEQEPTPAVENVPAGHVEHAEAVGPTPVGAKVPAGQFWHVDKSPVPAEYLPAPQEEHNALVPTVEA